MIRLLIAVFLCGSPADIRAETPPPTQPARGIVSPVPAQVRIERDRVELENRHFLAVIATKPRLALTRLLHRHAGSECLSTGQTGRLFAVAIDDRLLPADLWQVLAAERRELDAGKLRLALSLRAEGVTAELAVRLDDSWQSRWSLEATNTDGRPHRLRLFWVLDHLLIGHDLGENFYFYPFKGGWSGNHAFHLGHGYGTPTGSLQVMSLFNPALGGGVCLWIADPTGAMKTLWLRKVDRPGMMPPVYESLGGPLRAGNDGVSLLPLDLAPGVSLAVSPPARRVEGGGKLSLPEMVVGIHPGDWHEALASYTAWVRTWWRPPQVPRWLRQSFNICSVHHHESIHKNRYRTADRILPSHQTFQWSQWWENPSVDRLNRPKPGTWYPGAMGDYFYEPRWGGLEGMRDEVQRVARSGGRTVFLVQNYLVWKHSTLGRQHVGDWAARTESGQPLTEWTGDETNMDVWNFCVGMPAYQDYVAGVCERVLRETGADGIYLDSAPDAFPCRDPRHGHGDDTGQFSLGMLRKVHAAIRQANPKGILHIEDIGTEHHLQHVDGAWLKEFEMYPPMSNYVPHFDAYPVYFLRFYFPEVWFADWGAGDHSAGWRRCFFNGIGVCRWPNEYTARTGRIMRENAAAFASLHPEPFIATERRGVFANRFPAEDKTVYTLYNRNPGPVSGELLKVPHRPGTHFMELVSGREVAFRIQTQQAILSLEVPAGEVVAVAELPGILSVQTIDGNSSTPRRSTIRLSRQLPQARLVLRQGTDPNDPGRTLSLANQCAELDTSVGVRDPQELVLQLFSQEELVDQVRVDNK